MTQRDGYYKGTIDCFQKIYIDEGFKGYFRAVHIRTLTFASTGIIFFSIYENAKKSFAYLFGEPSLYH